MRKSLALALAVLGATAATAVAATRTVSVGDNWFVKSAAGTPTVTVKKNDYVKWVWRGESSHNVVVTKGPAKFNSPIKDSGSFRRKMTRRGTYTIICTLHGARDQSMKLVVK